MKQPNYKQREEARKRRESTKAKLLKSASEALGRLWAQSMEADSGFRNGESKAISDAVHSINSIIGGWARNRR
jgi:hypothetical protein